jgi:pantetheine-phosphate adenylyltransferase
MSQREPLSRRVAAFPATFDPVTLGHVAIAERAARAFERLIIGVFDHPGGAIKQPLFSTEERVALTRACVAHLPNASVQAFSGLTVAFARAVGAGVIVRGLRVADDFEFERQMAMMNHALDPEVETLLLVAHPEHAFVSASLVREVALLGGDVTGLVPEPARAALERKRAR